MLVVTSVLCQPPQLGLKTNPPLIQEKPVKNKKAPSKEELIKLTVSYWIFWGGGAAEKIKSNPSQ